MKTNRMFELRPQPQMLVYGMGITHALAVVIVASAVSLDHPSSVFKVTVCVGMLVGLGIFAFGIWSKRAQQKAAT